MNNNRYNRKIEHSIPFRGQNFYLLRESCLKQGILFEDATFKIDPNYNWLRPDQISANPALFVDGVSRHDVIQGQLGDCWLLSAMSAIACQDDLISRVVPDDQTFFGNYAGIFHFRIWQFGNWYDVVIDDRLPVDVNGYFLFVRPDVANEFWAALLEKAYLKLVGKQYSDLEGGFTGDALVDLTGGVLERLPVSSTKGLDDILWDSHIRGSVMSCSMGKGRNNYYNSLNMKSGHAYTITGVNLVNKEPYDNILFIRLRNPWGHSEWTGPWSDNSTEWKNMPDEIKREFGLVQKEDGEFWMSYEDFIHCFVRVDICHLSPDVFNHQEQIESNWFLNIFRGSWIMGVSHGGKTYLEINPQIRLRLRDSKSKDRKGFYTVIISLMQKLDFSERFNYKKIGVVVYKIENPEYFQRRVDKRFLGKYTPVAEIPSLRCREVSCRFSLLPGTYCIIPYMEYKTEGEYVLRVFTNTISYEIEELEDWSPEAIDKPSDGEDHSFWDEIKEVVKFFPLPIFPPW